MRHVVEQKLGRIRQWSVEKDGCPSNWGRSDGFMSSSQLPVEKKNGYKKNQKSLLQKDKVTFYHRPVMRYWVEITEIAWDGMPMSGFLIDHLMLECLIHNNNEH